MPERHDRSVSGPSLPGSSSSALRGPSSAQRAVGARRRVPRAFAAWLALPLACAGGAANTGDRYPEEKRPDAQISASDGEVLGAQRQDPADTLEGSLTNEHAAPRSPHAEEPAEAAHERLEQEECVEAKRAAVKAAASGAEALEKPVCPPRPRQGD